MSADFHQKLAKILHFHRKKAGLSRQALARLAGVGKKAVFDLEHAKPSVQLNTLLRLLEALNIQLKMDSPLMAAFREEANAPG
ncbi:MAG TPA: helix-turn-helix domain-containing protein [bacterium]|nr:helix-turn-helix domain-containing protein [bacterium]